jgi:hypothetical protein
MWCVDKKSNMQIRAGEAEYELQSSEVCGKEKKT